MECYCNSKKLYKTDYTHHDLTIDFAGQQYLQKRKFKTDNTHLLANKPVIDKIWETSDLWIPSQIETISWNEI